VRGDVQNVTYSGNATPDQKKCLLDVGRQKSLNDAPPGPGQLVCDYAGTVTPGTQMLPPRLADSGARSLKRGGYQVTGRAPGWLA
jgi:hypothetical protein